MNYFTIYNRTHTVLLTSDYKCSVSVTQWIEAKSVKTAGAEKGALLSNSKGMNFGGGDFDGYGINNMFTPANWKQLVVEARTYLSGTFT